MLPEVKLIGQQHAAHGDSLSRNQAASLLGVSLATVDKLVSSQYLPALTSSAVLTLAATPYVSVTAGVLPVLRTASAQPANDGRAFMGDAAYLTDTQFQEANAGWWRSDSDAITGAGVLAVSIGSFITGVLRVHGVADLVSRPQGTRHFYKTTLVGRVGVLGVPDTYRVNSMEPTSADLARQLLGSRTRTVSGGPIAYLTPDSES